MNLPFTIEGMVIHGQKRGRLIGFPTANIKPLNYFLNSLEYGVYASKIDVHGSVYKAATNIGPAATFNRNEPTIESYILNFNKDIYKQKVILTLIHKIRDVQKFTSLQNLTEQIVRDVRDVSLKIRL
ncbi:MAG: riboflavin kinase [Patescibacteria group bacterium]